MATLTSRSELATALSNQVATLLCGYEDFYIQQDIPGVAGYVMSMKTNLMVHIKHTRKNLFRPHSVYQATSMTALPNMAFMKAWIKNAREAAEKLIRKGDYREYLGEDSYRDRKFNQWIYYDRNLGILVGQVQVNDLVVNRPTLDTLRPSEAQQ